VSDAQAIGSHIILPPAYASHFGLVDMNEYSSFVKDSAVTYA
jgi:hypothetical protein